MHTFLLVVHVLVAIGLISLVLLQQGKGSDMGAGFGAGSSGTVFGARGASSFLAKVTGGFALLFFITSISLAVMATRTAASMPKSLLGEDVAQPFTDTITLDPSAFTTEADPKEVETAEITEPTEAATENVATPADVAVDNAPVSEVNPEPSAPSTNAE